MIFIPKPYQQTGIDHLGANPIGAVFAGMGLGKTAMVLARLSQDIADGSCRGALIVAPLRVSLFTWLDEVAKWENFRWMKIVSLRTPEGMAAWHRGDACIYTLNFESLYIPRTAADGSSVDHGIIKKILHGKHPDDLPVDTIVWDELSKAKSHKSKRIQFFRKYRSKFKRHWGLTGTPIPNSHQDLFAQMRLLDDGAMFGKHLGNFRQQYLEPIDFHERQWRVRPECQGMIEEKLLSCVLTLRSEDHLDIPPVTVEDISVSLPPAVKVKYKKLESELVLRLQDSQVTAVNKGVLVGKLQQMLSGAIYAESLSNIYNVGGEETKTVTQVHDAKIKALGKLVAREKGAPLLVVIRFIHERERILEAFPQAQAFHSDLLGDWNAGKIPMLVAHPLSISHGLNMQTGGSRIVWVTLPFSTEEYNQTNARLARTGQKHPTQIFRLLVDGTLDEVVVSVLESRNQTQDGFLQALSKNLKTLNSITK